MNNYLNRKTVIEVREFESRENCIATYGSTYTPAYNLITHIMLYHENKANQIHDVDERLKIQQKYNIVDHISKHHTGLLYAYSIDLDLFAVEKTVRE